MREKAHRLMAFLIINLKIFYLKCRKRAKVFRFEGNRNVFAQFTKWMLSLVYDKNKNRHQAEGDIWQQISHWRSSNVFTTTEMRLAAEKFIFCLDQIALLFYQNMNFASTKIWKYYWKPLNFLICICQMHFRHLSIIYYCRMFVISASFLCSVSFKHTFYYILPAFNLIHNEIYTRKKKGKSSAYHFQLIRNILIYEMQNIWHC